MSNALTAHHDRAQCAYRKLYEAWNLITPPFLHRKPRVHPGLRHEQQASTAHLSNQFVQLAKEVQKLRSQLGNSAFPDQNIVTDLDQVARDIDASNMALAKVSRRRLTEETYEKTNNKLAELKAEWNRLNRRLLDIRALLQRQHVLDRPSLYRRNYEVFISHSGEDKDTMAIPLYRMLEDKGIPTFFDAAELRPGGSGKDEMNRAMRTAKIGVFILSRDFAAKEWPMKELNCFLWRWHHARQGREAPVTIIPVFYRLNLRECKKMNDLIRYDSGFVDTLVQHGFHKRVESGFESYEYLESNLKMIADRTTGIENIEGASNEPSYEMTKRREQLQRRIVEAVVKARTNNRGRRGR